MDLERLLPTGSASQPEPQQHQAFASPTKQGGAGGETPFRCGSKGRCGR